jgi:hypothetical protein
MDQAELERPYSRQWWESRTGIELQDMLRSGLASGDVGVQAHREIERRARELGKAEDQKAEEKAAHNAVFRLRILGGVLAALLILLVVMKLIR